MSAARRFLPGRPAAFARAARHGAARVLERLPPRASWGLWRVATLASSALRRAAPGPEVALVAIAWGIDADDLDGLIERLTPAGAAPAALLVISDSDAVHVAAARGCRFEHVPPRRAWEERFANRYEDFASRRVESILASYRTGRVVTVGPVPQALAGIVAGAERLEAPPPPKAPAG